MQIRKDKYHFWIELEDLAKIKRAIHIWGKSKEVVEQFSGARLKDLFEEWESFVECDWENWDISEYGHDIGVRLWIQLAIENSSEQTSRKLIEAIKPLDELFIQQMHASRYADKISNKEPFQEKQYFWQLNSIYPEE